MTKGKIFSKKSLLTTASVLALGAFAASTANAVAITAGASTANDLTLEGNVTLTGIHTNATDNTASHVLVGAAGDGFTLTTGAFAHTAVGGGASGDWLRTSAATTASLVVSAGGSISSDGANAVNVLDLNHSFGSITVEADGTLQTTAGTSNVIDIATGITVAGITNAGDISANTSGIAINVAGTATFTNGIVNSGEITATTTGNAIKFGGAVTRDGTDAGVVLKNDGTLSAGASTAGVLDINGAVTGTINNTSTGKITATGAGQAVNLGGNITGGFNNAGTITTASGKGIITSAAIGSTAGITNSGTVEATGAGVAFEVTTGTLALLTNTGTIQSTGGTAIDANGAAITSLVNGGTIKDTTTGIGVDIGAEITALSNDGTISTATGSAIKSTADSATTIENTGVIKATGTAGIAINLDNDVAAIENTGELSGALTDVSLTTAKAGTAGVIYAASTGAAIDAAAHVTTTITNTEGLIYSEGAAAITIAGHDDDDTNVEIVNTDGIIASDAAVGTIDFTGAAANGGNITNTGLIVNSNASGFAIRAVNALTSVITNDTTGIIKGAGTSVIKLGGGTITGSITNKGSIIATATDAEAILLTSDHDITGNIDNQGSITTAGTGGAAIDLSASGQAITVKNSGTITGAVKLSTGGTYEQTAGSITNGSGKTVILGSSGAETVNIFGGTIVGNIDMGSDNSDAIVFGNADADEISVAGTIDFDDMTVAKGITTLSGVATGINAATSTVTITQGATLYSTGGMANTGVRTIGGTLQVAAGKTVAGTGAVALNGTYTVDVASATSYGQMTGAAMTFGDNGKITVDVSGLTSAIADNTTLTKVYDGSATLVNFDDGAELEDDSYIYRFTQVANGANDVDVLVERENTLDSVSSDANTSRVGAAAEAILNAGDANLDATFGAVSALSTAAEISTALKTLLPDVSGASTHGAIQGRDAAVTTIESRMDVARAEMEGTGISSGSSASKSGAWGQVFGGKQDQDTKKGVNGYQADVAGVSLGLDTAVSDQARVGAALSYANTSAEGILQNTDIDSYQLSLYGTYDAGKLYYEGIAGFAYNDYDADRTLFNNSVARANYNGQQYDLQGKVGYRLDAQGGLNFIPFVGLDYTHLVTDNYTETGSTANLTVDTKDIDVFRSELGAKVAYPVSSNGVTYSPHASLAWSYDFVGDEVKTTSNFTSVTGTTFTAEGAEVDRNSFKLGAGLDVLTQDNLTVSLDYDYEGSAKFDSHAGSVKARFGF